MKTKVTTNSPYTSRRTIETTIWIFCILLVLALLLSLNTSAITPPNNIEEAYIDDIPFNTEVVVDRITLREFDISEENYINDIPFNTRLVASTYFSQLVTVKQFKLTPEEYIDDIPFNTALIVSKLAKGVNDKIYACTE